jgi:hypothetical protein
MNHLIRITAMLLLFTGTAMAQGNDSTSQKMPRPMAEIVFKDGNILRGTILREDSGYISFTSDVTGAISIEKSRVLSVKVFNPANSGNQQVYANLASRYFFSPSAINMRKGDGYYQNTWFSLQSFNYAITNNITIGGGFELFSLLLGHPLFFFTPKIGFDLSRNVHAGAGYMLMGVLTPGSKNINLVYGNFTLGNADLNMSMNAGTSLDYPGKPLLTLSGFVRAGTRIGFMTENWLIPTDTYYTLYSFGVRVIGRRSAFDFGLVTNPDIATFIPGIPFLSYSLKF